MTQRFKLPKNRDFTELHVNDDGTISLHGPNGYLLCTMSKKIELDPRRIISYNNTTSYDSRITLQLEYYITDYNEANTIGNIIKKNHQNL